jgi:hypothetical protein
VDVEVERHRPVLHLLGGVPPQHVEHHRIDGFERLVVGPGGEQPAAQRGGEVLDRGDDAEAVAGPPPAEPAGQAPTPAQRLVGQEPVEHPLHPADERAGVEALRREVVEHRGVGPGVDGLLADEALHLGPQPVVGDVRQHVAVQVDEPPLTGRQQ